MSSTNTDFKNIPDVQSYHDSREIVISRVGIKDIRQPVIVSDRSAKPQHAQANMSMSVYLPADKKGTHMSRFTQLLNDNRETVHSLQNFGELFNDMNSRLESDAGTIEMSFDYFVEKTAPVSLVKGLMDYQVTLLANMSPRTGTGKAETSVKIVIPVTTLCPCSKEISSFGAHNQRSHVTIEASAAAGRTLYWETLIDYAESEASSELYSQLKRSDEKFVTERAYENPRFVEDLIRDIAIKLNADQDIGSYVLEVENFESIHNHSAYAKIISDR